MKFLRVPVAIALLLIPVGVIAQRSRPISLGSIAPANSLWDRALKQMATDVQRATDRRVRFRIAANTQGDEVAIVRRLMLGTTQAAALSQIGLEELDESFSVLGMPFFFSSDAEARHVLEALASRVCEGAGREKPRLDQLGARRVGALVLVGADQQLAGGEERQVVHDGR